MNKALFSALTLEKIAISLTIGLIVMVAALNIVASLILLVMEKHRDIAILKTMGASARSVTAIFMLQGLIIGAGRHDRRRDAGLVVVVRLRPLPADSRADGRLPDLATCRSSSWRSTSWSWSLAAVARSASSRRSTRRGRRRGSIRRRRCGTSSHEAVMARRLSAPVVCSCFVADRPWLSRRAGIVKSYAVGGTALTVLRDLDLDGRRRARWSRSSARRASARARCCTCSAVSIGPTRHGARSATPNLTTMDDDEVVRVPEPAASASCFSSTICCPSSRALENAEMPMRIARLPVREARPRAEALLRRVGLGERLTHRPGMLSGGEQQRVAVARALVMRPAVLLADEPTGDLDEQTADSLHALLREMHAAYGLTSIIATHNPRLAAACDRVAAAAGRPDGCLSARR